MKEELFILDMKEWNKGLARLIAENICMARTIDRKVIMVNGNHYEKVEGIDYDLYILKEKYRGEK